MSPTPSVPSPRESEADAAASDAGVPLYVDLDGTLIASDTLWEALCALISRRPRTLLELPVRLVRDGKAGVKAEVAAHWTPDAGLLPYRPEVLAYLERARAEGRPVILASASHERTVHAVAAHLELFDHVLASSEQENLRGAAKLEAIRDHSSSVLGGTGRFEYLGDSAADLPILRAAGTATLVAPTRGVETALRRDRADARTLVERTSSLRAVVKAMRIFQWAKNLLIFAPLLLAHELTDVVRWRNVTLTFLAFSLVASATYMINDLLDIEADRRHPRKARRPFASGTLPVPVGLAAIAGLLVVSLATTALVLPPACLIMVLVYLFATLLYSLHLKERVLLDVLVLAGLYTHRVLTGGVAAAVPVSPWLLAFSVFFFFSLALVKRYVELHRMRRSDVRQMDRRAYHVDDVGLIETMGMGAGYISVLILCLFISNEDVSRLYQSPILLWLMCPVMLYWISRIWLLARRDELHDDPVLFALRDRTSYVCGLLIALVMIGASVL